MKSTKKNFDQLYNMLNPQQKVAVDTIDGPVLVLAGPGTGKTQTLTTRIANILDKTDTPPDAILALTFTESGVRAMRERLISIIGTTAYYINIHTFHSFASEIIRSNADDFLESSGLEPLSDLERVSIFTDIIDELKPEKISSFNSPYYYVKAIISKIKDLKREGISPDEFLKYIKDSESTMDQKDFDKNIELHEVYKLYQNKLKETKRYDFEDMINLVTEKFKTSPTLLQKYQERFHYFLVDEFQDTNTAQANLLYQLSSYWDPNPNLFVVGDDDQSIYRFQGASLENILTFSKKYPNCKVITLKTNYRSTQPIIDVAESVISNNETRISNQLDITKSQKALKPDSNDLPVSYGNFSSSHTENYFIATEIKKLIDNGVKPSEIAVIYRNNADATDIADMLSRMQITYKLEGGENILETGIIIRLLHLLTVIYKIRDKSEDLDAFTLMNYEFLDLNSLDILKLSRFATDKKLNLFEAILNKEFKSLNLKNKDKLIKFYENLVRWNELEANTTLLDFIETVINESGYLDWILNQPSSYEYLNKLNSFLAEVKRLNISNKNIHLGDFLKYLDLMREYDIKINEETIDIETNAVTLSTAHKSKGLEFEYVFITKFIDKKWSNAVKRDLIKLPPNIIKTIDLSDEKLAKKHKTEDERRLFYVVLTRAKKHIYITLAKNYQSSSKSQEGVIAMFFEEIPDKFISTIKISDFEKDVSAVLRQLLKPKLLDRKITDEEADFLRHALRNFKISSTSLNTYLECPYKFKLNFLFKTPKPKGKPLVFGSAVHSALEKFYKQKQKNKPVDLAYLLIQFELALKKELLTDEQFNEMLREGKSILTIYYQTYEDELNAELETPIYLEKWFGSGFSRPLLDDQIHLSGKVDKMIVSDVSDKLVKIVDYKTGRPKSRNDILGKTKNSKGDLYRQLQFYKLLVDLDKNFNYTVSEVELDFIGNRRYKPKRETFEITDSDVENLKQTIREVYKNIHDLKFNKTDDYTVCETCDYRYHCWPDGFPNKLDTILDNE